MNWAFNKPEHKLIPHWQAIPDDTDILITHQPPYTIFDWSIYDLKTYGFTFTIFRSDAKN